MKALDQLIAAKVLPPLDLALARFLARRAKGESAEVVALTTALLSHERGRGHSCVLLGEWAGRPFPGEGEDGLPLLPGAEPWEAGLRASGLIGDGNAPSPLVLDSARRVYFYRYWLAERRLAARVGERLTLPPEEGDFARLAPVFHRLFPAADPGRVDWQAVAAAGALRHRFTIVTGGPGTGKTTTVARILALLHERDPDLRVALAAPTGKAAARLTELLREQSERLPLEEGQRARIPAEARTIHRLLGYWPQNDTFRHGPERPLAADVLVVDEASMVDLLLMDSLFAALLPRTRVILLGDEDQLASVETGYVLGDLCRAAGSGDHGAAFGAAYQRISGQRLPVEDGEGNRPLSPLRDAVIRLRYSYRFQEQRGIGELAAAVREGDSERALRILADAGLADVELAGHPEDEVAALDPILPELEACSEAGDPREALQRLGNFRILCATREGRWSVAAMNRAVEAWLRRRGRLGGGTWYRGRPVMITANDYHVRLFNGDIGVIWPERAGVQAWFPGAGGELRSLPLAKLPPHETAWALTVHKSQGSEFDHVLLVLPAADVPVLTRELLYTGVTRARHRVHLRGPEELVRSAINRTAVRASGLAEAVGGGQ